MSFCAFFSYTSSSQEKETIFNFFPHNFPHPNIIIFYLVHFVKHLSKVMIFFSYFLSDVKAWVFMHYPFLKSLLTFNSSYISITFTKLSA